MTGATALHRGRRRRWPAPPSAADRARMGGASPARGRGSVLRSLAVLMSALVAMSAQAQDASTTGSEGRPAPAARSAKAKRKPVIASRAQPVESALQAKPDAGVDAPTPEKPRDCG